MTLFFVEIFRHSGHKKRDATFRVPRISSILKTILTHVLLYFENRARNGEIF